MTGVGRVGVIGVDGGSGELLSVPVACERLAASDEAPIMSFFHTRKGVVLGREILEHLRARFAELVMASRTIVLVGIAIRRSDDHIWSPLARSPARIVYVAGEKAVPSFHEWAAEAGRGDRDHAEPSMFKEAMRLILHHVGLG